ncbi:MAG: hypothetical protein II679_02585, partial [Ruminococcus sp.]|nr:hypothetical protein [Ruminococcus sp.]
MTVSFLLPFYAKMLKNGLNSGVLSTATIKLRKLDVKKLTRHKLSNKQSFKLSTILDRKITRNPEKIFATKRGCFPYAWQFFIQKTVDTVCGIIYNKISKEVIIKCL